MASATSTAASRSAQGRQPFVEGALRLGATFTRLPASARSSWAVWPSPAGPGPGPRAVTQVIGLARSVRRDRRQPRAARAASTAAVSAACDSRIGGCPPRDGTSSGGEMCTDVAQVPCADHR